METYSTQPPKEPLGLIHVLPETAVSSGFIGLLSNGTPFVLTAVMSTSPFPYDRQDALDPPQEIVLVTVKQYLAVADHLLSQLFPNLPDSFWADTGRYPNCIVCIKGEDWNPQLH